jgi:hypothetical protein
MSEPADAPAGAPVVEYYRGPERRAKPPQPDQDWHLDKRIPIALVVTILGQTLGAVWWASGQSAALQRLQQDVALVQQERREEIRTDTIQRETLATLKETALQQQRTLERIERQIESFTRRSAATP